MLQRESVVPSLLLCALFMSTLSLQNETCGTTDGFDLIQNISDALQNIQGSDQTMMYTPNNTDYKSCPVFTLKCMKSEMKMLLVEWNIDNKRNKKILSTIEAQIQTQDQDQAGAEIKNQTKDQVQTGTGINNQTIDQPLVCDDCEKFPVENPQNFLKSLASILRLINIKCELQRELAATSPSSI